MDDNRTMAQLLEAPTEGYEDAIVVPEINANNFEIKHGLLNLVQNKERLKITRANPKFTLSRSKPAAAKVVHSTFTSGLSPECPETQRYDQSIASLIRRFNPKLSAHQNSRIVKCVVEESQDICVTCVGAHSYQSCPDTDDNVI
ncbi:hypothetical protein Tco_0003640 [Tanacetum coccineum]